MEEKIIDAKTITMWKLKKSGKPNLIGTLKEFEIGESRTLVVDKYNSILCAIQSCKRDLNIYFTTKKQYKSKYITITRIK